MSLDTPYLTVAGTTHTLADVLAALRTFGAWREAVDTLIQQELLFELAKQEGVTVSDDELQVAMDVFRKQAGLFKAADTEAWMKQHGITQSRVERTREATVLLGKLAEAIPETEVEAYIKEHPGVFDRVNLSVIDVPTEDLAQELLQQVAEEEAGFGALAREHSTSDTAPFGGGAGWIDRPALPEEVAAKVFAANPGDLLGPFAVDGGFRIVRVEAVETVAGLNDDVTPRVRSKMLQEKLSALRDSQPIEEKAFWT